MSLHIVLLILTLCLGKDGRVLDNASSNEVAARFLSADNEAEETPNAIGQSTDPVPAKPGPVSYPFIASIQMLENGKYSHLCGATIINELFLLTAAHCFIKHKNLKAKDLFVVAGTDQLFNSTALRVHVNAFKKHPDFYPFRGHDIALVQLATPLPIDNIRVGALEFRNSTRKAEDMQVELVGWGRTQPGKAKNIETVPFRTIKDETCFVDYRFKYLTNSEICAVNTAGPRSACDGDSGGPLLDMKSFAIYGLLSYGRQPCEAGKPFAFTRTSTYVKWIDKEMDIMESQREEANKKNVKV